MVEYLEAMRVGGHLKPGDQLFLDNLSSHKTVAVRAKAQDMGISLVFFPPSTAPDLSPCDNFFFSAFKNKFRQLWNDQAVGANKKDVAQQAYNSISANVVRACWRKCGLNFDPEPQVAQQQQ